GTQMRLLTRVLAGHDLVGLAALAVEVKNKFEARREPPRPVAGHPWPLVPDVPREAPPPLDTHPAEPRVPVRDDLVVAMDEPEIDQHLAIVTHRQMGEHATHQAVPVGNAARGVVALVTVRRAGEAQTRRVALHQRSDDG